jgi:hypothetical protein
LLYEGNDPSPASQNMEGFLLALEKISRYERQGEQDCPKRYLKTFRASSAGP